jgi:transposase-like protein
MLPKAEEWAMIRRNPFKPLRLPREVILLAVSCYCSYQFSYWDVQEMHAERGLIADT